MCFSIEPARLTLKHKVPGMSLGFGRLLGRVEQRRQPNGLADASALR
jgi:hypothetical protein